MNSRSHLCETGIYFRSSYSLGIATEHQLRKLELG